MFSCDNAPVFMSMPPAFGVINKPVSWNERGCCHPWCLRGHHSPALPWEHDGTPTRRYGGTTGSGQTARWEVVAFKHGPVCDASIKLPDYLFNYRYIPPFRLIAIRHCHAPSP
jgi:hypothetical protein